MRSSDSDFYEEEEDLPYRKRRRESSAWSRSHRDDDEGIPRRRPARHSRLGIASFVLALAMGLLLFVLFVIAGIMETTTPGGIDEKSPSAIFLGILLIGGFFAVFVALCLGIAGVCESQRKKVFAILGTICAAAVLVLSLLLMLIGSLMG